MQPTYVVYELNAFFECILGLFNVHFEASARVKVRFADEKSGSLFLHPLISPYFCCMEKKELTYEQAIGRVEQIVSSLESQETSLDELAALLKEAQELLSFCKERLMKAEEDINKTLSEGDGTR